MPERTCLIVDDEPSIRCYLKAVLEPENFQALEAESAPEAFRVVEKMKGQINLIVTDVRMPGDMDGVDLAFAVRNAFPAIPVILVSGYDFRDRRPKEFEFVQKPFKPETLLEVVKKMVG